jgi:alkyl hydroperoxide reductase subunit AhpC
MASVGKRAPRFELPCTRGPGLSQQVGLADYRDRWLILVFYPRDFSLVCPTELTALSARMEELRRRGATSWGSVRTPSSPMTGGSLRPGTGAA